MVFLRLTVKVYPRNPDAPSTGSPASFLLTVENPERTSLGGLASLIQEKWRKLRPHEGALEIKKIVDDAYESTDLDPDMTVADVWVDIGKARSDNCDQRGAVRVIQKPTDEPHAPVRFPSVTHDWDAAVQEFQRQRRVKNEPGSPRMGTIPEEGSQGEAEDSVSEEESGSEEETGSEEEAEEVDETESESESVEEIAEPPAKQQKATRDAESESEEETDDEEGSEEGDADVEPVAQAKIDQEQEEATEDEEDEESDNEEDEDDEDEEKELDVVDNAAKDAQSDEEETDDEDDSGEEESEESDKDEQPNDEMEVDEEEEVNQAPAKTSRLKRGRDADEFQKPNKQPRLDKAGRPRKDGEPSPEKRPENASQPGLGLGITKSPPSKKPAMINPSTPAVRRGPLFQTNGTPSTTLTPNTASQLPSALRKESPTQRSAVRRSVSFADEDDVVDESANKSKSTPKSAPKQVNQDATSSKSSKSQRPPPTPAGAAADTSGDEAAQNQEAIKKLEQEIDTATKQGQTEIAQHLKKILRHRGVLSNNVGIKVKRNIERAQRAREHVTELEKKLVEIKARSSSSTSTPASKKVGVVVPALAATNGDKSKSVDRDATPGPTFTSQVEAASEDDEDSDESVDDDEPLETQQVNLFSDTEEEHARTKANGSNAKEQGRKTPAQKQAPPAPPAPVTGNKNKRSSLKSLLDDQKKEQQERVQSKEPPAPPKKQTVLEDSSESDSEDSDSDQSQPDKGDIKPNGVIGTIRRALGGY